MKEFSGQLGEQIWHELWNKGYFLVHETDYLTLPKEEPNNLATFLWEVRKFSGFLPAVCKISKKDSDPLYAVLMSFVVFETSPIPKYSTYSEALIRTDQFIGLDNPNNNITMNFIIYDVDQFNKRFYSCFKKLTSREYPIIWSSYGPTGWIPYYISAFSRLSKEVWSTNVLDGLSWRPSKARPRAGQSVPVLREDRERILYVPTPRDMDYIFVLAYNGKFPLHQQELIASWIARRLPDGGDGYLLEKRCRDVLNVIRTGDSLLSFVSPQNYPLDVSTTDGICSCGVDPSGWKGYVLRWRNPNRTKISEGYCGPLFWWSSQNPWTFETVEVKEV